MRAIVSLPISAHRKAGRLDVPDTWWEGFSGSAEGFSGSAEGFSGSAEGFSGSGGSYRLTLIGTGGFVFSSLADFADLDLGTFQRANWRFFARKVAEGGLASAI